LVEIQIYNMAITRAQQAKQMLRKGGRIGLKGGADASMADFGTVTTSGVSKGRTGPGPAVGAGGASFNKDDNFQTLSSIDEGVRRRNQLALDNAAIKRGEDDLKKLYDDGVPKSNMPGVLGLGLNATKKLRDFTLRKNIEYFEDLSTSKYPKTLEGYTQYMKDRSAGKIDAAGNVNPGYGKDDRQDNTILLPQEMEDSTGGDVVDDTETEEESEGLRLAFRADGGRIGAMDGGMMSPEGGIMDLESGRQMYFLGKLVKKATRAVKKVVKSPVGKAALLGLGGFYLGGGQLGGLMKGASKFGFLPQMMYGNAAGSGFGLGNIVPNILNIVKMPGLAEKAFSMGTTGKVLTGITAASALAGLLTPEQEEEAQELARGEGIDIAAARRSILERAQGNIGGDLRMLSARADGGRIGYQEGSKEPVAKKTMPLLDMDGMEKDYREDGGFVPIGRMEKADDVPARLSKNEFVFTADAVRNAGDGDVDKGAEVMYNMMKNLESGGDVSEESQGLQGAREMFQTSKRLEEVL